ncbi:hypothetical protein HN011_006437 [Eciton burchellii]|nr:hypothetical protein HN011_006437 [Eciton burchellii]
MRLVEEHYYTMLSKVSLKALGIWPHDKSRIILLRRILIIILTMTYIIMQLSVFITTKYSVSLFAKIMSLVFPCIIVITQYCTFILKLKSIRNLHHQILEDWKIIQNELESEIMRKHIYNCRMFVLLGYLYNVFLIIITLVTQFFPIILDMVLPLDEPRPHKLLVTIECFVPLDKYFYIMVLHEFIIIILCFSMVLAMGTQLFVLTYHSFGMFRITSHRLEFFITNENYVMNVSNFEKKRTICRKVTDIVIAHRRAIEFCDILITCFNLTFCGMAFFGLLSLSMNLYRFVEATTISRNLEDMVMSFFTIISHLIYLYLTIFMGQKISDSNKEINILTYNISWYLMPVSSQKLILFLMQKSGKDFYLTIGSLLMAKMENFAAFLNTAMSYVVLMCSIQSENHLNK